VGLLVDDLLPCVLWELEAFLCDEVLHHDGLHGVATGDERVDRPLGIFGLRRSPSFLFAAFPVALQALCRAPRRPASYAASSMTSDTANDFVAHQLASA